MPSYCGFIVEQIHGLFRGGTATMMRETFGNMLFFTTYETTRYHLFTCFGLDPNRANASQTSEAAPSQSVVANTLLETGIGIVTGGLAGVAVSVVPYIWFSLKPHFWFHVCLPSLPGCFRIFNPAAEETGPYKFEKKWLALQFWSGVLPFDVAKTRIQTARNLSTSRNPLYHLQLVSCSCSHPFSLKKNCLISTA
jgi:hypothetical protein